MKAYEIMTTNVVTVSEETSIKDVVALLLKKHISGLPVVNQSGLLTGIVTEGDLLRRSELGTDIKRPRWLQYFVSPSTQANDYIHEHAHYVGEVMTTSLITVNRDALLDHIITQMEQHNVKRLPVTENNGNLVGIITRSDVMKALNRIMQNNDDHPFNDELIKRKILDEIASQPWIANSGVKVFVKNGVVELTGCILSENFRPALCVIAESIVSKEQIRDRLVYIEPVSGLFIPPAEDEKH